jgi:uracil-DNA glycosylase family 4
LLVALGRYSASVLSGKPTQSALSNHGRIIQSIYNVPLLITYHPAAALRNSHLVDIIKKDLEKIRNYL